MNVTDLQAAIQAYIESETRAFLHIPYEDEDGMDTHVYNAKQAKQDLMVLTMLVNKYPNKHI